MVTGKDIEFTFFTYIFAFIYQYNSKYNNFPFAFLVILGFIIIGFENLLWLILIGFILMLIGAFMSNAKDKEKEAGRKTKEEEKKAREKELLDKKKQDYSQKIAKIHAKYGTPDKTISIEEFNADMGIMAFGQTNRLLLLGNDIPFSSVLNCTFTDNYHIKEGTLKYESKQTTNNGNALGRAVVGGILAGGVGAVIGGTTANKDIQTTAFQDDDKIIHDYTIIININSLTKPIIRIDLKENGMKVNEIMGLMNVIMAKNK